MNAAPDLPTPAELGFPPKFERWYPDQLRAIDLVIRNGKRFTALAMPTGSGKSLTGITAALLHGEITRALYLTASKGLQDQLAADFRPLGLYDVRGARNYPCRAVEAGARLDRYRRGRGYVGCDEGPCHSGVRCDLAPIKGQQLVRPSCDYYGALWDARSAPLVSSNYAMYLAASEYGEGLGSFDCLVLDEAHDADKELEAFLTIEITQEDCKFLHSKFLGADTLDDWISWAQHHAYQLKRTLEAQGDIIPNTPEAVKELQKAKGILGKLERLAGVKPTSWLLDNDGYRAKIAPLHVARYAERYLFRGIKHVVLMSATMTLKTTQLLGIPRDELTFHEVPSRFPVENRRIVSINTVPSVRVDFNMHESTKYMWQRRIDRLIDPRRELGWKGIIHTVSYQRMTDLLANSEHKDIMLVHDSAGTREAVKQFKESAGPRILVSPSIVTGYDFPDDQCRFQIIGKVPQIRIQDPITKARHEIDKEYTGYLAMLKLVQACGRGVRGPEDWCETFIVDDHFADWFLKRFQKHAPKWFLDAVLMTETYPEPLEWA